MLFSCGASGAILPRPLLFTRNYNTTQYMNKTPQSTYGIDFYLETPTSVEELESIHGRAGVALELAIKQDVAHTILGKIRRKLAETMAEAGWARPTKTVGDKEIDDVPKRDWFAKGFTFLGWDTAKQREVVQGIADTIGYDITSDRGTNGGPAKSDYKDAETYLVAVESGQTTFDRLKGNLERLNPGMTVPMDEDGTISIDDLAAALRVNRRRIEMEAKQKQNALL
jgi:hypothetical protein